MLDAGGGRRDLSPMNALEVAPRAKAGHVFGGVVAAVGAELQVMRRDVATAATGTLAAIAIALVDLRVLDFGTPRTPRVDEVLAGEAQESGAAQGGPAVPQIDGLPMPEIARGAGAHAEAQGHAR